MERKQRGGLVNRDRSKGISTRALPYQKHYSFGPGKKAGQILKFTGATGENETDI